MILKQILHDLRKNWSWALFYSVVTAMVFAAIVLLSTSFSYMLKQSSSISKFVHQNVVMFTFMGTDMRSYDAQPASEKKSPSSPTETIDYLQRAFSDDGNAGSFVFVNNGELEGYVDYKYNQILVLLGEYGQLAGFEYDTPMAAFVPEDYGEEVGAEIAVGGSNIPIAGTIDPNFALFHPMYYYTTEALSLPTTLVLCTKDLQATNDLFYPWWNLNDEVFERLVLVHPTDAEVSQLQNVFYHEYGKIYKGITAEEFTRTTQIASMRAYKLYLTFYITTGLLLIALLALNIMRMIEANMAEYTIHHMYGAPISLIQRRVGGFAIALNLIPLIAAIYMLIKNEMKAWFLLPVMIIVMAALYVFSAQYVRKRIGTLKSLENLRRDY